MIDDAHVIQGRDASRNGAGGDEFFEEAADDFSGAGFWQGGSEIDIVGLGDGTDDVADVVAEFVFESNVRIITHFQGHEAGDCLAFEIMRATDNGGLRDGWVSDEGGFDFRGSEAVAGDVEHIIEATDDPEVALFIAACAVASSVDSWIIREVGFFETRFVTVDRAGHGWPWFTNYEAAIDVRWAFVSSIVEDGGIDTEERAGRGSGNA